MELRDYQLKGVEKLCTMLKQRGSALLADEMGLGKTVQAITVAHKIGAQRVLVVCLASLRLNWKDEIAKWSISGEWEIVSYEWLVKHREKLKEFDVMIVDEAHYCKNPSAKRTKAVKATASKIPYKLFLTGTPCPNGIIDGFNLFNWLSPNDFPNRYRYGWRYCNVEKNWFTGGWNFVGANKKNMPELRKKLSSFMVRRRKVTVLSELPNRIYSQLYVQIPKSKDYRLTDEETQEALRAVQSDAVATKARGLGLLKADKIKETVESILLEKNRLVIFTYHQSVSDKTVEELRACDCTPLQITGATPMKERHEIVTRFQNATPEKLVLVAQQEAAGVGINLTAADTCIFLELSWRPAVMAQAMDRLHRIGQKNTVQVIYCIAKGTLDEQIIGTLIKKIRAINEVMK